jgi:hypothetical protein
MKFVIKWYRSRDVDGQKFFVRTVNKLPYTRLLLFLEQSLVLKGRSNIASWYSLQVLVHNSMPYGYFESIGSKETLPAYLWGL